MSLGIIEERTQELVIIRAKTSTVTIHEMSLDQFAIIVAVATTSQHLNQATLIQNPGKEEETTWMLTVMTLGMGNQCTTPVGENMMIGVPNVIRENICGLWKTQRMFGQDLRKYIAWTRMDFSDKASRYHSLIVYIFCSIFVVWISVIPI